MCVYPMAVSTRVLHVSLQLQRQEEDVRARMSRESDAYRKAVTTTQAIRQEYFNFQYPRLLRVRMMVISPSK